jgi:hypothetical protein
MTSLLGWFVGAVTCMGTRSFGKHCIIVITRPAQVEGGLTSNTGLGNIIEAMPQHSGFRSGNAMFRRIYGLFIFQLLYQLHDPIRA